MGTANRGSSAVPRWSAASHVLLLPERGRNCRDERTRPTGDGALSLARRLHGGAAFHMSAHLEENLRALDPQLAAEIRAAAPLPLETAASGEPTLTADNVLLHSRHDPRREAARWAETQRERLAEGATAVVP